MDENNLHTGYKKALEFTSSHYENFPVVSFLIEKRLRKHVAVIYQFARQADDMADEGTTDSDARLHNLNTYESELTRALKGECTEPFWCALKNTVDKCNLSEENLYRLLSAFKQDVTIIRYNTFADILAYCSNSANPIGRLILELHGIRDSKANELADKICTALQLTNFYQDISLDILKNRIYIPVQEMSEYGISENQFDLRENNDKFKSLLELQVDRVQEFFNEGRQLLDLLSGRLRLQIKWTILGGEEILKKIRFFNYNTLKCRPQLSKIDMIKLLLKSWTT
ncbi:MAG: squalene synthase HpnC [Melioribacteraceae bacterium]|nr:squalene synthase HpnC [Melioribacteraceae bacterium]